MGEKVEAEMNIASLGPEASQSWGRTRSEAHLPTNFEFDSPIVDRFEIDLNLQVDFYWEPVCHGREDFLLDVAASIELGFTSGLFVRQDLFNYEASLV